LRKKPVGEMSQLPGIGENLNCTLRLVLHLRQKGRVFLTQALMNEYARGYKILPNYANISDSAMVKYALVKQESSN
jgi:hypothetical protein